MLIASGAANEEGLFQNKVTPYFTHYKSFDRIYLLGLGLSSMIYRVVTPLLILQSIA